MMVGAELEQVGDTSDASQQLQTAPAKKKKKKKKKKAPVADNNAGGVDVLDAPITTPADEEEDAQQAFELKEQERKLAEI